MEHSGALQLYGNASVSYTIDAMVRTDVELMLQVKAGDDESFNLLLKAGDDESFNLLLQKYRTPLVNFLFRMVKEKATAEDLAQEVFLRVYRARKQYSPSAKFTTWMFRIATNLALNSVRDNRHRQMDVSGKRPRPRTWPRKFFCGYIARASSILPARNLPPGCFASPPTWR